MKKVILFGGTFDPIHQGHIKIALAAKKQIQADEVIFILSKNPRWKTELWRKTCAEKNIPFHDMREKGYFTFSD